MNGSLSTASGSEYTRDLTRFPDEGYECQAEYLWGALFLVVFRAGEPRVLLKKGLVQGPDGLIAAGSLRPGELIGLNGGTGQEKWSPAGYHERPVMSQKDGGTLSIPEGFEKIHVLDGNTGGNMSRTRTDPSIYR